MRTKLPITDFLHHKVIINHSLKNPSFKYSGLVGRVVAVKTFKSVEIYQIHFSKSEDEMKKNPKLNDAWFTRGEFSLTK